MSLTAAASGFVVLLLSLPVIQGQNGWRVTYTSTEICAVTGSTVEIHCRYTYPSSVKDKTTMVKKKFWFAKVSNKKPVDLETDRDYTGRVEYLFRDDNCTLRITDLRESDAAVYKFRFTTNQKGETVTGEPGVRLSVTVAPKRPCVSVSPSAEIMEGDSVTLTCSSDANPAATYTWYKDGNPISHSEEPQLVLSSIQSSDSGRYYCTAVNELGTSTSESISVNVKYAPKSLIASVSPSGKIRENSEVTLTCSSDANPAATYTWYKDGRALAKKGIKKIKSSDSGHYHCVAKNEVGTASSQSIFINIKYAPELPSVSVSPTGEIVEGSSVTLTCSSDANPAATYTWYKENRNPGLSPSKQTWNVQSSSNQSKLVLRSIQPSDSGQYSCTAENRLGKASSQSLTINVKYAPKRPSVSVSPSGSEIRENSEVTLTCSSDANPAATYTWYKENRNPGLSPSKQTWNVQSSSNQSKLVLRSIQSSDSGQYFCTAENRLGKASSQSIFINVKYAPKRPSVSVSPSGSEIRENSEVTLTCSSDANPAATYTWYKENGNLKPLSEGPQLVFSSIQSSDSGQYYCAAVNELGERTSRYVPFNVKYAPKLSPVSVSPSGEIRENSEVTLTCSSDANPAANYTWYKEEGNGKPLSEKRQLVLSSIQSSGSGQYYCTAENELGSRTSDHIIIHVKYAPQLPSVSVSPSAEIVEGRSVTLTCSSDANPAAKYTWYKENQTLLQGPEGIYRFTSIHSSDSGSYHCKSENQHGQINSSSVFVDVQYAPKLPSVSVSPSAEIVEGSSVTLTCSSDANPAANYTWYKEDEDSPKASGQIFTITDITAEHSGNYYCEAQNSRGRHGSTIYLGAVAGSWILITVATVSVVVLAIILTSVFLWIMKKRASKHPSGETPYTREQLQLAEQPNELHYATVRFSKNPAQPRRYAEAENVVYAVVKFDDASLASRSDQEAVEDPAALYSTVNKKRDL